MAASVRSPRRSPSRSSSSIHKSIYSWGVILVLGTTVLIGLPFLYRVTIRASMAETVGKSTSFHLMHEIPASSQRSLEIAWLMTYPNSGTTYTLKLIQEYTNTTTATNYGNEQGLHGTTLPIDFSPEMKNGPYYRHPTKNPPPRYILTKTHCGGTSTSPLPRDYVETVRSFEVACRSGNRIVNGIREAVTYNMSIPKRAVHVFRNPFDNIVARLHMEEKRWENAEGGSVLLQVFNATREGFQTWCHEMDHRSVEKQRKSRFLDEELWDIAKHVPCHGEFIRYTWWHNHAIEVTRRHSLPVHVLFYEQYADNWESTVMELFNFLQVTPAPGAEPLQFITGKHYGDFFDPEEIEKARELVLTLASPETWTYVKKYFPQDQ